MSTIATLNIDCSQIPRDTYGSVPTVNVGIGEHIIALNLTEFPQDLSPQVTRLNEQIKSWQDNYNKSQKALEDINNALYEKRNEVDRLQRQIREAQQSSEDSRPPQVSNETLQALLTLFNRRGTDWTTETPQVQVTRLLTGWGLAQAQGFVRTNHPQQASALAT